MAKEKDDKKTTTFGRPRLPDKKKRTIEVKILVNDEEFEALKTRFEEKNLRGNIRTYLLASEQKVVPKSGKRKDVDDQVVYQLKRIGGNLNQLLFLINRGDIPQEGETKHVVQEVKKYILTLLEK